MDLPSFAFGALFMAAFIGLVWFLAGKLTTKPKPCCGKFFSEYDCKRFNTDEAGA